MSIRRAKLHFQVRVQVTSGGHWRKSPNSIYNNKSVLTVNTKLINY